MNHSPDLNTHPTCDHPLTLTQPAVSKVATWNRSGFSLIEIIVAMAICMLGLAAILQMSNLSQSFARKAADTTELQILCQNRINEVLARVVPLEPVSEGICPENPGIGYSLSLEPDEQLPLVLLEVSVRQLGEEREQPTNPKAPTPTAGTRRREQREREVTLRRWLALPRGETLPSSADSPTKEPAVPAPPGLPSSSGDEEDSN
jgi:prepilin-type N-terminal cleavage/methylation domain-containing protein